jgi:hypothetical protein
MSKSEWRSEIAGYIAITIFALGWMDVGFGPEYTWWNIIAIIGQ